MVAETRAVHAVVDGARERLSRAEHARASELEQRVRELEGELRRLSDEVSTDALTQVANRRGLLQAFEAESARVQREGAALAVGLIDIDNFKKLNDSLGHAAGDEALKALAARVKQIAAADGSRRALRWRGVRRAVARHHARRRPALLARLQRQLSAQPVHARVVVKCSSPSRPASPRCARGEALDAALERADRALYEAKRSGKNRTCAS